MTESPPRRGRGRRPIADVRADVLTAAAALLLSEGVSGFTMEKVIKSSGVSPTTVFKHWPSRGALALDAYLHTVRDVLAARDTGEIVVDLERMVVAFVRLVSRHPEGPILAQLVGAAQIDPDLAAQFDDHYFGPRRRETLALLAKAQERGQIAAHVDLDLLVDMIWGACYVRLLLPHLTEQLTEDFARQVVRQALAGTTQPGSG